MPPLQPRPLGGPPPGVVLAHPGPPPAQDYGNLGPLGVPAACSGSAARRAKPLIRQRPAQLTPPRPPPTNGDSRSNGRIMSRSASIFGERVGRLGQAMPTHTERAYGGGTPGRPAPVSRLRKYQGPAAWRNDHGSVRRHDVQRSIAVIIGLVRCPVPIVARMERQRRGRTHCRRLRQMVEPV